MHCTALFFKNRFYLLFYCFLPARAVVNFKMKRIYAPGWFVQMENNKCTLDTNNCVFGRTFYEKIFNFKNILPQPKTRHEKEVYKVEMNKLKLSKTYNLVCYGEFGCRSALYFFCDRRIFSLELG